MAQSATKHAPSTSFEEPLAGPKATRSLVGRRAPLAPPEAQRELLERADVTAHDGGSAIFSRALAEHGWPVLSPVPIEIFQINLGKLCNMTCRHCHVDAGPDRSDAMMSRETIDACLTALSKTDAHTVDLTGGAPEIHPDFNYLVERATSLGKHVIDRCNLTILLVPRFHYLPDWLAERGVEVVASLPHCRRRATDAQRGDGTYEKSIVALKRLNAAGYGQGDPRRRLTLMSNPSGAFLAGDQSQMERDWKAHLASEEGVYFDRLFTLNNMPISRFLEWLVASNNLQPYLQRLVDRFNADAVQGLMCRNTISISWDGRIFDCDFNQMLDIEAEAAPRHIGEFDPEAFQTRQIRTGRHCFGCTAGSGSSCGGKTAG